MKVYLLFLGLLLSVGFVRAEDKVGYYIGSFDMVTLGHQAVALEAMDKQKLSHVYITVNHNTDKDFNTGMDERIQMLRDTFRNYSDRVTILREPLEGRPEFARYLIKKHGGKVLGIFGDDTFDKNYKIFTSDADVHDFDYIKVARPQALESVESAYKPVIHDMEIDSDGTSSSAARDLIANNGDPAKAGLIAPEVWEYIKKNKLYLKGHKDQEEKRKQEQTVRFRNFITEIQKQFSGLNLNSVPEPTFKSTQSKNAQNDKFIRQVVTHLKLPLKDQFQFRTAAEKLLGISYSSKPLRSPESAGIYIGSFDGKNPSQIAVIENALSQGIDKIHIGILGKSRKPLQRSQEERKALMKEQLEHLGNKVDIFSLSDLDSSRRDFEKIANEYTLPTLAIFGANVFDDNYNRLKGNDQLRFAKVPMDGSAVIIIAPCEKTLQAVASH